MVERRRLKTRETPIRSYIQRLMSQDSGLRWGNVTGHVMRKFGVSRQAVNKHLKSLMADGIIDAKGGTKGRKYMLKTVEFTKDLEIAENREEHIAWEKYMAPYFADLPETITTICYYGFTEMYNNVVDHSDGKKITIGLTRSQAAVAMTLSDDGVGIFEKIKRALDLEDHREAILELSKGKLTTDPEHHSGQGIFFTSRVFDSFLMGSGHLFFSHKRDADDWHIEAEPDSFKGTWLQMEIASNSSAVLREVFDRFTDPDDDDYSFSKTHVPLNLARYEHAGLVSRSQAKRVLARFDKFREVSLDFARIESIGQGFADEVFRVFRKQNPGVKLLVFNAAEQVQRMIRRAESTDPTITPIPMADPPGSTPDA